MEGYARIGDTCLVGDGTHSKIERQDSGVLYLTSRNFKDGILDLSKVYYISESDYAKHFLSESKALTRPETNDLVFSIIGTIGEPYLVRQADRFGISSSVAIVRPKRELIDPTFLLHWFKGPVFQSSLFGIKGGVAQGYVSLEMIRSLPLPRLPLPFQRRIAGILSAYDELIENSQRRIRILEPMARALYREWFFHFRFPGYEKLPRVASPIGCIPQGWRLGKLADVSRVIPGYAFKSSDWQASGVPVVKIKNIQQDNTIDTENTDFVSDAVFQATPSKFVLSHGDILIAMTGATAGKIGKLRVNDRFLLNQRVAKILPDPLFYSLVWCAISTEESQERFFHLADGAAQPNMSGSQIEGVELICPPRNVAEPFSKLADPILKQTDTLYLKIQNLRRTRDVLLPRLLSGQGLSLDSIHAVPQESNS